MNDFSDEINLALQEVYEQISQLQEDRDELAQHILAIKNENQKLKEKLENFEKKLMKN